MLLWVAISKNENFEAATATEIRAISAALRYYCNTSNPDFEKKNWISILNLDENFRLLKPFMH